MNRRNFLKGCLAAAVAPAIVHAENIMPIRPVKGFVYLGRNGRLMVIKPTGTIRMVGDVSGGIHPHFNCEYPASFDSAAERGALGQKLCLDGKVRRDPFVRTVRVLKDRTLSKRETLTYFYGGSVEGVTHEDLYFDQSVGRLRISPTVDKPALVGLRKGEMTVFGARRGGGKSAIAEAQLHSWLRGAWNG